MTTVWFGTNFNAFSILQNSIFLAFGFSFHQSVANHHCLHMDFEVIEGEATEKE